MLTPQKNQTLLIYIKPTETILKNNGLNPVYKFIIVCVSPTHYWEFHKNVLKVK